MASLTDFMAYVLPYVSGCSYPLAELHIRDVCRDFCTYAPVAQHRTDPQDVVQGVTEYDIDLPSGADVTFILEASYCKRPLKIWKTGDINLDAAREQVGAPVGLIQSAGNSFTLDLTPAATVPGALAMLVATKPARTAQTVPDVLLDHAFAIGQGVAARLVMMPGHEFTNLQLGATYNQAYERGRAEARIRAEMSFGSMSSTVRPRRFQ